MSPLLTSKYLNYCNSWKQFENLEIFNTWLRGSHECCKISSYIFLSEVHLLSLGFCLLFVIISTKKLEASAANEGDSSWLDN
jgi:hypothetical protein